LGKLGADIDRALNLERRIYEMKVGLDKALAIESQASGNNIDTLGVEI